VTVGAGLRADELAEGQSGSRRLARRWKSDRARPELPDLPADADQRGGSQDAADDEEREPPRRPTRATPS
jgi:hypothetical protein